MLKIHLALFRLQKYKKFESNSQPYCMYKFLEGVVSTAKVQKIWEQFTTKSSIKVIGLFVVSTAKVQKIWEQFTTSIQGGSRCRGCFDCKSTKNLRAIHNLGRSVAHRVLVVSTAKVQKIWEQFTTRCTTNTASFWLFRLQKYKKFESNSQHGRTD